MKSILILLSIAFLFSGCASPRQNKPLDQNALNIVELDPPANEESSPSRVYIDSLKIRSYRSMPALVVQGSFPDGCTKLKTASHQFAGDTLALVLEAWKNPNDVCTQALTSFTFIYNSIPPERLTGVNSVTVNGRAYKVE